MKCLYFVYVVLALALTNAQKIYECTESKTIALTFDDGPFKYTRQLVDYLIEKDVKATFFTVGKFHYPFGIETPEFQEAMKLAHDHGMQIASHTFGHKISEVTEEFRQSLTDQEDFIERVTGDRPRYFRAPKGICEEECQANLNSWNYRLIQWEVDPKDWDYATSGSQEQRVVDSIKIIQEAFEEERDNYLILLHDSLNHTVDHIAPWIIEESGMREKGYRFVTVAECLGDKEGMYVSGKTYGDDAKTPSSSTNSTDVKNEVVKDGVVPQNLSKSDAISLKQMMYLPYLCFGFLISFLFYMI